MNTLIQKACDIVGGQTALAKLLSDCFGEDISQQRVHNWVNRGDEVPTDYMAAIEAFTNKSVSRKDFKPNTWQVIWPELAGGLTSIFQPKRRSSDQPVKRKSTRKK